MMTRREWLGTVAAATGPALSRADTAGPAATSRSLADNWEHYRGSLGGIWEVWRGPAASANVTWARAAMPHCFNAWDAADPDRPYYQGQGWYRTTVALQNPFPNGRTLLHFEGAGQKYEVFIGLESASRHVGGYDGYTVDITDAAARSAGETRLAVLCDNSRGQEMIPSDQSDFNRYGGRYRHVNLRYVPAVSIERMLIDTTGDPEGATAVLSARLHNPGNLRERLQIETSITDPSRREIHASTQPLQAWNGVRRLAEVPITAPNLWSPRNPNLYGAAVTLPSSHGDHRVEERFGIRFFEFPNKGVFQLNGERLLFGGTQRHEDHAGLGAAMTDDLIRRELQLIKDMGANFLRLAHYQQSRIVLDLCDELRLLVWEEIPWCRGGLGGEQYKHQACRMLRNMIDQHRNHPAVIFWGLGNENDWPGDFETFNTAAIRAFLAELPHQSDPSRLTAIRRCSFAADVPDVYSPSIWAGWYSGRYTEYKAAAEKEARAAGRMLHIEWGGDSHAGRHAEDPDRVLAQIETGQGVEEKDRAFLLTGGVARPSRDGDWSETYICNLFDWHLKEQESMPFLSGAAQWIFKDFATPDRPDNPIPRVNQKGFLERDLTPKEGYYVFQSYGAARPMAHIYGHSWPVHWGRADETTLVKVYSNCPTPELFLNGKSCGTRQRRSDNFPAAGLRWQVTVVPGEHHLRVAATKDGIAVSDEIRFRYQTGPWDKPARFSLQEVARAGDGVTVEALLVDANDIPCLDARRVVRFRLAGDGELFQNLGTTSGSRQVQLANGRAAARVGIPKGEGMLSISAEGVPTAFQTIHA